MHPYFPFLMHSYFPKIEHICFLVTSKYDYTIHKCESIIDKKLHEILNLSITY